LLGLLDEKMMKVQLEMTVKEWQEDVANPLNSANLEVQKAAQRRKAQVEVGIRQQ